MPKDDVEIASVGKSKLMLSEVGNLFSVDMSPEDSIKVLRAYAQSWINNEVKVQQAEKVLGDRLDWIDSMVGNYRRSLLVSELDKQCAAGKIDTMITDQAVSEYYESHRNEFVLDRAIVKGRIVRLPDSYRQSVKLLNLMESDSKERQSDFDELCKKNNFELHQFDSWVDLNQFLSYLPLRGDADVESIVSKRTVQQMSDRDSKYFVEVTDYLRKGDAAPLERMRDAVRRIVYNSRRSDIVRNYGDSLQQAAYKSGLIIINTDSI